MSSEVAEGADFVLGDLSSPPAVSAIASLLGTKTLDDDVCGHSENDDAIADMTQTCKVSHCP